MSKSYGVFFGGVASAEDQRFGRNSDGGGGSWESGRAHQKELKSRRMTGSTEGGKQARGQGPPGAIVDGGRRVRGASGWPWAAMGASEALVQGI